MSKIQFNLLPDAKVAANKAQVLRRKVRNVALVAGGGSALLFIILLSTVYFIQQQELKSTAKQIQTDSQKLEGIANINKAVTVQNQLKALAGLHQSKHITSRIFTYLPQLTPASVTINKLDLDLKLNTMSISGIANSQQSVNTFVDTLKAANYKVNSADAPAAAFSGVVESGFNLNSNNINYTISLQFDPKLFANNLTDSSGHPQTPKLIVTKAGGASNKSPSTTLFNSTQTGQ